MSKKNWTYIGFFVVLVVGFYFALMALVPDLAKKRVPPISYVRPFAFTNQYGEPFTEKNVAGKVYVAEYFFTTCKSICPVMNTNMKKVFDEFKGEKNFLILSHTSTPDIDSVSLLKKYADSMGVNNANWIFLTGRKDSLYQTARISYAIDDPNNNVKNIKDDFLHTQFWALIDKNGDVRKIYDGLKPSEVKMLISDIKEMLKE
ncbi:MAG: SCO family protein [Chitinophagaceae bacterium]|nr:SCO family protein [Chitinophagaceae bacterium]